MATLFPVSATPQEQAAARRLENPIHTERHIRIICIGAGASGLLMAYKLQRDFTNYELQVYEKNPELSGTWYENRYPGCKCDVPSTNYTWSFFPKSDWAGVYASSQQIFEYFNDFANTFHLGEYIKTEHEVIRSAWNNKNGGYDVQIRDLKGNTVINDHCDVLINAGGILNAWRWPAIPGLDKYKGTLLHTANWDDSVDLTGKHVGLIGNGSSGIQVLPAIREKTRKVTTFIREPTWVSPVQGLEDHEYSEQELREFKNKPGVLTSYRKDIETGLNGQFGIFLKDNKINEDTRAYMVSQMKEKLSDDFLESKLIPDWALGCRRLTPGVNYLESLTKDNVEVVYGEISEITEKGCLCDSGEEYPLDVLVCATGFDTSFRPRFPVVNEKGQNLQDKWAKDPESYFGMAAAGFPNYLMFLGPNCPIGNGPVLSAVEAQADWICQLLDRYQTTNMSTFAPSEEAVGDFIAHKDRFMSKTVWADPCRSWYKPSADGPVVALWPGSTLHYIEALRELRMDDLEVKYAGNRFAWLGNGYSQTELDETADWAYYIRESDDAPPATTAGRRRLLTKTGTVKRRAGINFSGKKDVLNNADPGDINLLIPPAFPFSGYQALVIREYFSIVRNPLWYQLTVGSHNGPGIPLQGSRRISLVGWYNGDPWGPMGYPRILWGYPYGHTEFLCGPIKPHGFNGGVPWNYTDYFKNPMWSHVIFWARPYRAPWIFVQPNPEVILENGDLKYYDSTIIVNENDEVCRSLAIRQEVGDDTHRIVVDLIGPESHAKVMVISCEDLRTRSRAGSRAEPDMESLQSWVQRFQNTIWSELEDEIIVVFCNHTGIGTSTVLGTSKTTSTNHCHQLQSKSPSESPCQPPSRNRLGGIPT
ncbi:FAD/NAD(P)-binding domain-containing protein [Zalerion maritima]|uniref:FAD/NAD(P)-binding domain-containing protein n=1 Tax=Zalerion maritima TaxID=339359 RepID=A0AAD5RIK4_9PEZI|nr:FAD/NAD(P)-binding domain-containing protein [Zalerion maritima]